MEVTERPNIHIMELYGKYFFYDVNTNSILSISLEVCKYLLDLLKGKFYEVPLEIQEEWEYLIQQGYLKPVKVNARIEHYETAILKNLYENNLNTVILQVTQNCNLRCEYCVYSGSYINRVHNNKRMPLEVAKAAILFLAQNSKNSKTISIGFYGGEPLLEFELIQNVVEYAEQLFSGRKVMFNMTTNATLLNMDKARYLYEKKFNITVSLDGPRNIHDSNRIFANSNKGTFDTVMANLEEIRRELPSFCETIGFNAVIDLKQNVSCTSEFFLKYDTVKNMNVSANQVNPISKKEDEEINPELLAVSYYEIFKTYLYACRKDMFREFKPTLYGSEVIALKQSFKDRFIGHEPDTQTVSPGGQCLPGIQRFFITVDGKFFPCERVDEESDELCIGDLTNGFDLEAAKRILNVAQITADECKKCWCSKLCYQCVAKAGETGSIESESRIKWCAETKLSVENNIKNYIILKKYGCRFD